MKRVYTLSENPSGNSSMTQSFLYGNFERQHSILQKAALPNDVRTVFDVDMVLIYIETDSQEVTHYKICNFADETLFTAMRVKVVQKPRAGVTRRESFQYLVKRFERNDPLVVKPRYGYDHEVEIHCPGGRVWGRCSQRLELGGDDYELRDLLEASVYVMSPPQTSCACLPFRKKRNKFEVRKRGEKRTVSTLSHSNPKSPIVVTFPENLDGIFKVLFIGSAINIFNDSSETVCADDDEEKPAE